MVGLVVKTLEGNLFSPSSQWPVINHISVVVMTSFVVPEGRL